MTAFGMLAALAAAACLGYAFGYRRGARTQPWRKRMSRPALARQATGLITLVALSQLQRAAHRRLPVRPRSRAR
ncbi:hypothetical protein MPRF_27550 [Mycolicibacterium parafortuitum]|uniref:Uncharacterized protein n=1 Tax=Mycolicibacterium parafortuitum TaxID=39692 RepID=A0A7I7U641_MYCPF|nr:hypothetical protein [Mycolicibacterium parafortuitum]BBY75856.1 hypothetical protein MPRF_27550 [Mycolicibacterium parafortuitum]